jgi:outer membrane protein TolC
MANGLYKEGRVNYLDVLDAERAMYQSEDEMEVGNQAVSLDLIALYKALGGGWETLARDTANDHSTAQSP